MALLTAPATETATEDAKGTSSRHSQHPTLTRTVKIISTTPQDVTSPEVAWSWFESVGIRLDGYRVLTPVNQFFEGGEGVEVVGSEYTQLVHA
jgi:hypothetical protein